ncbi:glycosyltransferase [Dyadobacter sp. MSC1_007]|jgi:cellulose synthase/poly-beta-1,6-N-acetylglucosamine synthase-like glycosyltransferase|uniref:glycosyltransferase n=1 Tax=Dyadobacter sp. MSC1_007 TaxID=2909264 RepID=UPI002030687E|nr:glycosyltransferase [Dyadobacter sp. MSC1_007]
MLTISLFVSLLIQFLWIVIPSYALFTLLLAFFWQKNKKPVKSAQTEQVFISVIIPVRNEAENIPLLLRDLAAQTWPASQFEVLVMDDSSTDNTAEVVKNISRTAPCNIRLITLPDVRTSSPKKRAIETAISQAKGKLVVTTDGDCRARPGWLAAVAAHYAATGAKLISSPVTFNGETSFTDHLQTVEFASLIGSGAASIAAGYPSMCNGANLAYEKDAFLAVNGYDGVRHLASGDDEFLMHKIAAAYPGSVHFLRNREAIISTAPHKKWNDFFRQRKRWASKWKHYQSKTPLVLALYIFACNLSCILSAILWLSGYLGTSSFLILLALKCVPEWLFLGSVLMFLQKTASLIYIPITQIFYPCYVCFFGLAAQKPHYEWKGRKLS